MTFSAGRLKGDSLLLLAAIIWGFAFVAQRSGMAVIGPFAYSAARSTLGTLSLIPLLIFSKRRSARTGTAPGGLSTGKKVVWATLAGLVLFAAANLQQMGLVSTTAGNAGFITGLYVILVPIMGIFAGRVSGPRIWAGASLAVVGLYILSVGSGFKMAPGDILELVGAFFWAGHILVINRLVTRMEALEIAVGQFTACSVFSLIAALVFEPSPFAGLIPAALPILYGGPLSIGVAYTLQVVAQKTVHPAHASIIMSMEALFAGIGGVLLLHEPLTLRLVAGGLLMLAGMIVSQLERRAKPGVAVVEGQPAG
jgi:drug/metabolite transporter (DMT)-like permease